MIRLRENPMAWQAWGLSLLVHAAFLLLLIVSFSWQNVAPLRVAEVDLWDSLPTPPQPEPVPVPEPPPPQIERAPAPPPPPIEPKAEIVVKVKPQIKPKPEKKVEKPPAKKAEPKPDPTLKAKEDERLRQEALRKLQQDMLSDDAATEVQQQEAQQVTAARAQQHAAAHRGAVDKYRAGIQAKIKRHVNRQLCGNGKPVLEFSVALMPTGEVMGVPRLQKSSGIAACDQAVERAILQAQPLPVPGDPELFAQFRDLNLQFRPNEDN